MSDRLFYGQPIMQEALEKQRNKPRELSQDEQLITRIARLPEWKALQRYVMSQAGHRKNSLYAEDHSGHEFLVGRSLGWLSASEWITQLPNTLKAREERNGLPQLQRQGHEAEATSPWHATRP